MLKIQVQFGPKNEIEEWSGRENNGILTVQCHHRFASDVYLDFDMATKKLVNDYGFPFLSNAEWI